MDNKGQSLVFFVLLLPFVFLLIMTLSEVGNLLIVQNKYETEIKSAIGYGLKHIDEEGTIDKVKELLDYSIPEEKEITILDKKIEVRVQKNYKILGKKFKSDFNYIGYMENKKIIIDRK